MLGLADEARARADELLGEGAYDEERGLVEWFVEAYESANRPVDAE